MALLLAITAMIATACVPASSEPFDFPPLPDLGYIFNNFGLPDYSRSSTGGQQMNEGVGDYSPKTFGYGTFGDDLLWEDHRERPNFKASDQGYKASDQGYGDGSQHPSSPLGVQPIYEANGGYPTRYPIDIPAEVQQPSRVPGSYPVQNYPTSPYQTPDVSVYGIDAKPRDSDRNIYNPVGGERSVLATDYNRGLGTYPDYPSVPSVKPYPASQGSKDTGKKIVPVDPVASDLYDVVRGKQFIGGLGANAVYGAGTLPGSAPQHTYPADVFNYRESLKCQPEFFFEYERDFSGPVWQDAKGDVRVQNGRAVFGGQGSIAVPFFSCNDLLPRYSMSFVLSPSNVGGTRAVLGNSLYPDKASFLVSLTGSSLRLTVRERAPDLTADQLLAACWQRKKRSVDGLPYFGGALGGSSPVYENVIVLELPFYSGGQTLVTVTQENDWIFFSAGNQRMAKRGRLPTLTNEPLYIGTGADPLGQTTLSDYVGSFDSFLFEKCPQNQ